MLQTRPEAIKLKRFVKIVKKEVPSYLSDTLPATRGISLPGCRNPENFKLIKTRTETYRKSFIPASLSYWNELDLKNRTIQYAKNMGKTSPNPLYFEGTRDVNIKHAQLRMKCSKLNLHLFLLHVVDSPACSCGFNDEDSNHYLLYCPNYNLERQNMLRALSITFPNYEINEKLLLFGSEDLSVVANKNIFKIVHSFIRESK